MTCIWRRHLIICLFFGVLTFPIYFLDRAFASGGGGNWITLDFRGLIIWTYITLIAIHLALSSAAVLAFPRSGLLRIHFGSMVLSVILLGAGVFVYGDLRRQAISNQYQGLMKSRRSLVNVIELKEWWYLPDDSNPTEIRVSVVVHQSGRFAGNVIGQQTTDQLGSARTLFESINGPETQRQVGSGEAFIYSFPLKILQPVHADNVTITLYLFETPVGPSIGDITTIFMNSPPRDDDGQYFYGVLPPPSRPK